MRLNTFGGILSVEATAAMSNLSGLFAVVWSGYVTADIPTRATNEDDYSRGASKMECKKLIINSVTERVALTKFTDVPWQQVDLLSACPLLTHVSLQSILHLNRSILTSLESSQSQVSRKY